jgi:hypothetical protein
MSSGSLGTTGPQANQLKTLCVKLSTSYSLWEKGGMIIHELLLIKMFVSINSTNTIMRHIDIYEHFLQSHNEEQY